MKTILSLCAAMAMGASIASAQTQCPTSYGCGGCVFDLHCFELLEPVYPSPKPPGGGPCPAYCYDLPAGSVAVAFSPGCFSSIQAVDDYQVFGLDPGQQHSFTVHLRVQGQISGTGAVQARIRDLASGGEVVQSFTSADSPVDRILVLQVQHAAEEVFRLSYYLEGDGYVAPPGGSGQLEGRFEFGDLPSSAYVVSCHGYYQNNFPTPVLQTTWGDLKLHYR